MAQSKLYPHGFVYLTGRYPFSPRQVQAITNQKNGFCHVLINTKRSKKGAIKIIGEPENILSFLEGMAEIVMEYIEEKQIQKSNKEDGGTP